MQTQKCHLTWRNPRLHETAGGARNIASVIEDLTGRGGSIRTRKRASGRARDFTGVTWGILPSKAFGRWPILLGFSLDFLLFKTIQIEHAVSVLEDTSSLYST